MGALDGWGAIVSHTITADDVIAIKDFYLGTPVAEYKYPRILLSNISNEIVK